MGQWVFKNTKKKKKFCKERIVFFFFPPINGAAAKSLQSCPTLCDPIDGSPPASAVLGFSRQEHWSGLINGAIHMQKKECGPLSHKIHKTEVKMSQSYV